MVNSDSKILIFMCDHRSQTIESYVKYASLINQQYAKKHGYDFIFLQPKLQTHRHPAWNKIDISIELLSVKNYHIYVYIDSDCIFNKQDISISQYLNSSNYCLDKNNANIVFIKDSVPGCKPCSGFFVFNPDALKIFIDWRNNHSNDDKIFYLKHPWEQQILQEKKDKYNIKIIDDKHFGINYNNFIIHLAFKSNDYRLKELKKYYFDMIRTKKIDIYTEIFTTTKNDS